MFLRCAVTPDDRLVFATMTGYSCTRTVGSEHSRRIVEAGPNDMWITQDGAYPYQIYPNASMLIGYACTRTTSSSRSPVRTFPATVLTDWRDYDVGTGTAMSLFSVPRAQLPGLERSR